MKRLLSAILTLALVLTLVPAVFADGTTLEVQEFEFTSPGSHTSFFATENSGYAFHRSIVTDEETGETTNYYINETYSEYAEDGSRNWRIYDASDENIIKSTSVFSFGLHKNTSLNVITVNGNTIGAVNFALAFKANQTGFFIPEVDLSCSSNKTNWVFRLYVAKMENKPLSEYSWEVSDYVLRVGGVDETDAKQTNAADSVIYTQTGKEILGNIRSRSYNSRIWGIRFKPVQNAKLHISADKTVLDTTTNKTASVTSTVTGTNLDGSMDVADGFVKYYSDHPEYATVDADTGVITAVAAGTANITAKSLDGEVPSEETITITVKEQDTALTSAFIQEAAKEDVTETYIAPTVTGTDFDGNVFTAKDNNDGTFTLTAPEANDDDEAFLYWAKGMDTKKKIISFDNVINNYVPAENGRNYLIAVYEGDITDTTNEYYNINGQLIAKQKDAPTDLPSIPGLGTAEGWENCGGNIWVAKYADTTPAEDIEITAGDNCTLNKTGKYAYGEKIICTANGTGTFKCWIKNDEIVSIDESYTFHAWEDCTVEAVYEDHYYTGGDMKILIDSFSIDDGVTGVMAEFIGFEDADVVEKGIIFTDSENKTTEIPMTTTDNQLTVVADAGEYVGYAILKEGTAYKKITDGSYEHN